ncbi:MAG: hypothetical protein Kow00108_01210 [Calditrichia bacterium]
MTDTNKVNVIFLDEIDQTFSKAWIELLKESVQASFFHQIHYLKLIQDIFNRKIQLWVVDVGNRFLAGGVLMPSNKFSRILTSPYYVPYMDVLFFEPETEHQANRIMRMSEGYRILKALVEQRVWTADFTFSPESTDLREFIEDSHWNIAPLMTMMVDLMAQPDIMEIIHRSERRQIKNQKVKLHFIHSLDPHEFSNLILSSYQHHNMMPPLSQSELRLWISGLSRLTGVYSAGLTDDDGKLMSGLIYVVFKNKAYFLLGGSRRITGPSFAPYLFYLVYQELKKRGIRYIDLLGGNDKSITKFKIHMGGRPVPYYRISYNKSSLLSKLISFPLQIRKRKRML